MNRRNFLESSHAIPLNKHEKTIKSRPPLLELQAWRAHEMTTAGFSAHDFMVTTRDIAKEMRRMKIGEKKHVFALDFSFSSLR